MIFPIGDTQVKGGHWPIFCYMIIAINIYVFYVQLQTPGNLICEYSNIPAQTIRGQGLSHLLTSMFLHGGWMHIIGNMLFLLIFGDNIEAVSGSAKFLKLYLIGGLFSSFIHIGSEFITVGQTVACCYPCQEAFCEEFQNACKGSIPTLGASGAIAAIMGAYIVMFPKSKIKLWVLFFRISVPAILFLGFWFYQQIDNGLGSFSSELGNGGVAWWAHIGGFVYGLYFGWNNKYLMQDFYLE